MHPVPYLVKEKGGPMGQPCVIVFRLVYAAFSRA